MPLVIQFRDGLSCPTILCDACQQPITDAKGGGYFFPMVPRQEGKTVAITFLHKGACDRAYEARHGRLDCWEELRHLPTFLARNLVPARHQSAASDAA